MKQHPLRPWATLASLLMTLIFTSISHAQYGDILSYGLMKTIYSIQYDSTGPKLFQPTPYTFSAEIELLPESGGVATLKVPTGTVRNITAGEGYLRYRKAFATKTAMDSTFPIGRYQFRIDSSFAFAEPVLFLPRDSYPSSPTILNWSDLQSAESTLPIVIRWPAIKNGTEDDVVYVSVFDSITDEMIYTTEASEDTYLNGLDTECTLPADVLWDNSLYFVLIGFFRQSSLDTTTLSPAYGQTYYSRINGFELSTLPSSASGRFQFHSSRFTVDEGAGSALISVVRSKPGADQTIRVSTGLGTAVSGQDYLPTNIVLQFPAGVTSNSFSLQIKDDYRREGNETVRLVLSGASGNAELGPRSSAIVTIVDDEKPTAGTLQFSLAKVAVPERATNARLVVSRVNGSAGTISARYTVQAGTATEGADFQTATGILQFNPGQTSQAILIPLLEDTIDEPNETFVVSLSELTGGASLGLGKATVSITDNDAGGVISFATGMLSVGENDGVATLTVKRTSGLADGVSVNYATISGTASDQDFTMSSGTLLFAAGETNKLVQIAILPDGESEISERFTVRLNNPTGGAKLGTLTNATVTITQP